MNDAHAPVDIFEQMNRMLAQMRPAQFAGADGWQPSHDDAHPRTTSRMSLGTPPACQRRARRRPSRRECKSAGLQTRGNRPAVSQELLHIDAETAAAHKDGTADQSQSRSRRVSKRIHLGDLTPEDATASYHNGVLEVRFPAVDDAGFGHRIDID
ncbi:hypothetical protein [Halosegnis sp.]|uniref:hypothetical protein n=1 Tax=Halosegnis sp. TaxID=2864959 RepID=UPI0035D4F7C1